MKFIVRYDIIYSVSVEAENAEAAIRIARGLPADDWDTEGSSYDAEPEDQ